MKEYIKQIYDEGLGLTLYKPVESKIKKIKNNNTKKLLIRAYKILYLLFSVLVAIILFIVTYPL